jgi:hypothetical protein
VLTLVHLRTNLPHAALAELYGVGRSTVSEAIGEIRPLLARRGFAVPDRPCLRLRTLADVFAYAAAKGVTLRVDGMETRVRRPQHTGPDAARSSPARRSRTPSRPPPSATARAAPCGTAPTGQGACTTRPPCAPKASPNTSASTQG